MPNWCSTDYNISRPKSMGGIKPLYDFIKKTIEEECKTPNDCRIWLGDIVEKGLGVNPEDGPYECRGWVSDVQLQSDEEFSFYTDTAWGPMNEMWFDLCKKYVPGATIYYNAEEPGCCVYATNNPDYEGKYVVDSWNDEYKSIWDASESDVRNIVKEVTGEDTSKDKMEDINDVLKLLYEGDYDISINPWDYDPEQPDYEQEAVA